MNIIFTLLAAAVLTAPKGSIYNNEQVVTNVDLTGLASTADIDGKRDKTDLAVYAEVNDVEKAYLAPECLPVRDNFFGEIVEVKIEYVGGNPSWEPYTYIIAQKGEPEFGAFDDKGVFAGGRHDYTFAGREMQEGSWPYLVIPKKIAPSADKLATTGEIGELTGFARATYNYMLGNTNVWFSGTNYPDKANAQLKHKFQFEPGMDLLSVPCSMALKEIRDGERGTVWDQRDWVSWYWSFKSQQMWDEIAATNKAIVASIPRRAWGSYTARGLENPDPTTVWVDRENTTLAAGMAWQNAVLVNGCGYWTIVGRGISLSPDEKRTSLDIRDFDGKSVMRIIKGESYLAPVTQEDFIAQGVDGAGRITFTIRSNVKPFGEYSTVPDTASFVAEDSENCPADWEWEQVADGWKIHFLLKSGIVSNACFARFKVSVEGQSTIEYTTAPTISGGLIYNGVKIAPVISGDTVTWKVVK